MAGVDKGSVYIGFENYLGKIVNQTYWNPVNFTNFQIESLKNYIEERPLLYKEYVNQVLINFPEPRFEMYADPSFEAIKTEVFNYFNPVID